MKKLLNNLSLYFETVPGALRKRKWLYWILFTAITIFMAIGITRNNFDMTLDSWFSDEDPIKVALNNFRAEFGSEDGVFIVYRPKDGDIFSEKSLRAVQGIRQELLDRRDEEIEDKVNNLKRITKIDNILSANILKVEKDTLVSKKFIGDEIPTTREQRELLRAEAKKQDNFELMFFSKDFQYGGISIETNLGTVPMESEDSDIASDEADFINGDEFDMEGFDDELSMEVDESESQQPVKFKAVQMEEYLDLMTDIEVTLNKPEYTDHLEYFPVGNPPLMKVFMEMMMEMGPLYGGMLLVMIVLLWFLFKSLSTVVWPVLIVVLSSVWTIGFFGWLNTTITNMITLTVMLILAVGVADSIHILSGYLFFRNKGNDHKEALNAAFRKSALPCLLTCVTTMVGMLALTLTPINHIRIFGFSSAVGVGVAFILTIYLLPLMMDLWSPVSKSTDNTEMKRTRLRAIKNSISKLGAWVPDSTKILQPMLNRILLFVEKRPYAIIMVFLSIFLACVYGATRVKIDSNVVDATREGHRLRIIFDTVDEHMMGAQNMEIMLDFGVEDALQDQAVLKAVDEFQVLLEEKYKRFVVKTSSLADVVKDAYQVLNEDREEMHIIPDDRNTLAQTLFMFNNANPEDRRKLVADDYSKSHVTVQLYNNGSYEYTNFFDEVQEDLKSIFEPLKSEYPLMELTVTGGLALIMELTDYISKTQIRSLGFAILIISIMLIFLLGSTRVGFLSIIPNLIPATLTFGALGLFDIPLDSDTIIIAPVIIGIAVDDTIHFLAHYRAEILKTRDIHKSLVNTLAEVGQAITFTSLILGIGFSIMAFSSYMSLVKVGIFGSLAIFVALACDLFLLPALMLVFKPMFLSKEEKAKLKLANSQGAKA